MIDANLLRQLGWSEELIRSVSEVAEPLRATPGADTDLPEMGVHSTASSAVFSEAVVNQTAKELIVQMPSEEPKSSAT